MRLKINGEIKKIDNSNEEFFLEGLIKLLGYQPQLIVVELNGIIINRKNWINTQIKALSAKELGLRALAYNFETIRGKVYIAGITSRPDQLDSLIELIKNIKDVNEIVNYVVIKE